MIALFITLVIWLLPVTVYYIVKYIKLPLNSTLKDWLELKGELFILLIPIFNWVYIVMIMLEKLWIIIKGYRIK